MKNPTVKKLHGASFVAEAMKGENWLLARDKPIEFEK